MAEPAETPYAPLMKAIKNPAKSPAMSASGKMISTAIAIANISIGSVYFNDCPAQYLIPYYLIISGVASILLIVMVSLPCGGGRDPPETPLLLRLVSGLLFLFSLAFFIAGNVWIYSIYAPNYSDPHDVKYCHKGLYLYAFWMATLFYIFLGVTLVISCCAALCVCCLGDTASQDPEVPS